MESIQYHSYIKEEKAIRCKGSLMRLVLYFHFLLLMVILLLRIFCLFTEKRMGIAYRLLIK